MTRTRLLRIAATAVAMALGQVHADEIKSINVPAGDLTVALEALASQSGVEVIYRPEQLKGLRTKGVQGTLSSEEAARKLIEGTALTVRSDPSGLLLISSDVPQTSADRRVTNIRLAQAETTETTNNSSSASSADDAEDRSGKLEEIIVTAQKREERLRDVPISITAFSGARLERSTENGVTEVLKKVPGVATDLAYNGAGTLISVRGIQNMPHENGSPTAGFYLDNAPFGAVKHGVLPDASPYDLDRVEVLRGPQATLYGAGSMTGLVRVLTQEPDLGDLGFKARTSVSGTQSGKTNYRGDAALNLPLVNDRLAARAVVSYQDLGGWLDRPDKKNANDGQVTTVRLKIKAQPNDQLTLGLSGWTSRTDLDMPAISKDGRTNPFAYDQPISTDYDVYSFKADYAFGTFTASAVSSYLDYSSLETLEYFAVLGDALGVDIGNQTLDTGLDSKVFTQELTLGSTTAGPLQWTLGAMYRKGKDRYLQSRIGYGDPDVEGDAPRLEKDTSESVAVYGRLAYSFFHDRLELAGGLRYFHDKVGMNEISRSDGAPASLLIDDTRNFERLSPEATLTWRASQTVNLYTRYAEGFRSGYTQEGSVYNLFANPPSVKPDVLRSYEIGSKGELAGGLVSFDVAFYYQEWDAIKAAALFNVGTEAAPNYISLNLNGQSGSGFGTEFGISVRPADGLTLAASFGWNDLTSDADILTGLAGSPILIAKGERFDQSPEYTGSASLDYIRPIGSGGLDGLFSTSLSYVSPKLTRAYFPGPDLNAAASGYLTTVQAMIGVRKDHWELSAFVDNLTNENERAARSPFGDLWSSRLRPRTIGLQASYKY